MAISKKFGYLLFSLITFILVGALALSGFTIHKKNKYISEIKAQIKQNETAIANLEQKKTELEQNLETSNQEKSKISSELEAAKNEKSNLEKENSNLKSQIEKLKAKKKAEAALIAATQPQPTISPVPNNTEKVCYLTFDDGPSNNTLKILEILKRYGIKATFFVINTDKIEYLKNIQADGHTIGLHSASHVYSQIYANPEAYFNDLQKISDIVESYTGIKSNVIRFPGGGSNTASKKYYPGLMTYLAQETANRGYAYFDWNVSSEDASAGLVSYTKIRNSVLNGAKNKNNICVLMHDAAGKTTTVDALPSIIDGLIQQGYSFQPLTHDSPGFKHSINN